MGSFIFLYSHLYGRCVACADRHGDLSLRLMAACEGRSGGEDEAAVGVWGNPRNPLNPRQSAIQTRKGGDGPGTHGRLSGADGLRTGGWVERTGRYFILVLKWIWAFHGATAV